MSKTEMGTLTIAEWRAANSGSPHFDSVNVLLSVVCERIETIRNWLDAAINITGSNGELWCQLDTIDRRLRTLKRDLGHPSALLPAVPIQPEALVLHESPPALPDIFDQALRAQHAAGRVGFEERLHATIRVGTRLRRWLRHDAACPSATEETQACTCGLVAALVTLSNEWATATAARGEAPLPAQPSKEFLAGWSRGFQEALLPDEHPEQDRSLVAWREYVTQEEVVDGDTR